MRSRPLLSFLLGTSIWLQPSGAQEVSDGQIDGYVTRYISMTDFDVNGRHIVLDDTAKVLVPHQSAGTDDEYTITNRRDVQLYPGEAVEVFGESSAKHTYKASELRLGHAKAHDVAGIAVIEQVVLVVDSPVGPLKLIRADGYSIRIATETKTSFKAPLSTTADIGTNIVVRYEGTQGTDGVVVAKSAIFFKNSVSPAAKKLQEKWEYDPQGVPAKNRQSNISIGFRGFDPSQFSLHPDEVAQKRVGAIGERLVPRYQRELAKDDPSRINFRFYVIDMLKLRDAFPLPSGIVLVPYTALERLKNNDQVAALLADKIAWLLEQQPVPLPETNGQIATNLGLAAAEDLVPFAGLIGAAELPLMVKGINQADRNQQQRERVSLSLMRDAGFDLVEAPKAWWLLSQSKPKDLSGSDPPASALYLYGQIASTWTVHR